MSGFAQMAGALVRIGELHSVGAPRESLVKRLRKELIAGPKTSAQLQVSLDITNQAVWGRLKRDIDAGRVVREGDFWVWKGGALEDCDA